MKMDESEIEKGTREEGWKGGREENEGKRFSQVEEEIRILYDPIRSEHSLDRARNMPMIFQWPKDSVGGRHRSPSEVLHDTEDGRKTFHFRELHQQP